MLVITRGYQLTYPLEGPKLKYSLKAARTFSACSISATASKESTCCGNNNNTLTARDCGTLKRDNNGSLGFHGFNILFFFFSKSCGSFRCHPTHAPCFFENQDRGVVVKTNETLHLNNKMMVSLFLPIAS